MFAQTRGIVGREVVGEHRKERKVSKKGEVFEQQKYLGIFRIHFQNPRDFLCLQKSGLNSIATDEPTTYTLY